MKLFKVEVFKRSDFYKNCKGYGFAIGHRQSIYFLKKKDAEKYARRYGRIINATLHVLSDHHLKLYSLYRHYYFQLSKLDSLKLENEFNEFNEVFGRSFKVPSIGNCFNLTSLEVAYDRNENVLMYLKTWAHKHKQTSLKHELDGLDKMLSYTWDLYQDEKKDLDTKAQYLSRPVIAISEEIKRLKKA